MDQVCFRCYASPQLRIMWPCSKGDWIIAENQPVVIEVDLEDEKILKAIVYTTYQGHQLQDP
jgi:hypothetical protein